VSATEGSEETGFLDLTNAGQVMHNLAIDAGEILSLIDLALDRLKAHCAPEQASARDAIDVSMRLLMALQEALDEAAQGETLEGATERIKRDVSVASKFGTHKGKAVSR
jgi:hypothetical protein